MKKQYHRVNDIEIEISEELYHKLKEAEVDIESELGKEIVSDDNT